jgi:predicted transcriptional regulator of viral defense system
MTTYDKKFEHAVRILQEHGGIIRTREALDRGIHRRVLYAMRDLGVLECLSRGVYKLKDIPPLGNPDLVIVARRVPDGVICLISALSYHSITTQIPHEIYLAIPRTTSYPRIEYPPVKAIMFSEQTFNAGIEEHEIDNTLVRIYSPEKTIADCFKYRNKLGIDVAVEALKLYRERKNLKVDKLIEYAKVCRVEKVMKPYLEATL